MLFAGKNERGHLSRLVKTASGGERRSAAPVRKGLLIDGPNGVQTDSEVYVPGRTYVLS